MEKCSLALSSEQCKYCPGKKSSDYIFTLFRLPRIFSIGFIDSLSVDEIISLEEGRKEESENPYLNYKIEEEIDINQFVKEVLDNNQDCSKLKLQCVAAFEKTEIGLLTYATYFKDEQGVWLRATRFDISVASPDFFKGIKHPKQLIYMQTDSQGESRIGKQLISIMKTRHEFKTSDALVPLPFFYAEKTAYLGHCDWQSWQALLCVHGKLLMNYFDIYKTKTYSNLLYKNEYENLKQSKTLRIEREQLTGSSVFFDKLMLGTTLLPLPIAEALLESDPIKSSALDTLARLWDPTPCAQCSVFYASVRKVRVFERYLFLRYQTAALGRSG